MRLSLVAMHGQLFAVHPTNDRALVEQVKRYDRSGSLPGYRSHPRRTASCLNRLPSNEIHSTFFSMSRSIHRRRYIWIPILIVLLLVGGFLGSRWL